MYFELFWEWVVIGLNRFQFTEVIADAGIIVCGLNREEASLIVLSEEVAHGSSRPLDLGLRFHRICENILSRLIKELFQLLVMDHF